MVHFVGSFPESKFLDCAPIRELLSEIDLLYNDSNVDSTETLLSNANQFLTDFMLKTGLIEYQNQNEANLNNISQLLMEFQISPNRCEDQSLLIQQICNWNELLVNWMDENDQLKQDLVDSTDQLFELLASLESTLQSDTFKLQNRIVEMKRESIDYKNSAASLQIENLQLRRKSSVNSSEHETVLNGDELSIENINHLFKESGELDRQLEELSSLLLPYHALPAEINLAKVELAKCDALLDELTSQREDLLFRKSNSYLKE